MTLGRFSGEAPGPDRKDRTDLEIHCTACKHYFITHDPQFPYGCRAVGFKSRVRPCREMTAHSEIDCQCFLLKER
jgi:hypothetical protein